MMTQPELPVGEFVMAAHGDLPKVQSLLAQFPDLLNVTYYWDENNPETALQAASHVGNRAIAQFLLERGAPINLCTAAMLGRKDDIRRLLAANPAAAATCGAHGISLMFHAALSGDPSIIALLLELGVTAALEDALLAATVYGHTGVVDWLLKRGTNPNPRDAQHNTPLTIARVRGFTDIVRLLWTHGGIE